MALGCSRKGRHTSGTPPFHLQMTPCTPRKPAEFSQASAIQIITQEMPAEFQAATIWTALAESPGLPSNTVEAMPLQMCRVGITINITSQTSTSHLTRRATDHRGHLIRQRLPNRRRDWARRARCLPGLPRSISSAHRLPKRLLDHQDMVSSQRMQLLHSSAPNRKEFSTTTTSYCKTKQQPKKANTS